MHDGLNAQLQELTFLSTTAISSETADTNPDAEVPAVVMAEECFNPGTSPRQQHAKIVMHDAFGWQIPVSFLLPAQTRVLGSGTRMRLHVQLGRNNKLLITGTGIEDIDPTKFPTVSGLLTVSRVCGEPRQCTVLVLELTDDEPGHELKLGNQPGAFQTKDLGDCMLSLVRRAPAQQKLKLAA